MAKRVLIVDDEAAILRSTALMVDDLGYVVSTCDDASGIMAAVEAFRPDVILQDVRMPGLDIEALVRELRTHPRWRRVPIILFTASLDAEAVGSRTGVASVLDKPFRSRDLERVLEDALGATA